MICPNGHASVASDYCDVCGAPLAPASGAPVYGIPGLPAAAPIPAVAPSVPPIPPIGKPCPVCQAQNPQSALFCEACGYDFTTGSLPRGASAPSSAIPGDAPAPVVPAAPEPNVPVQAPVVPASPESTLAPSVQDSAPVEPVTPALTPSVGPVPLPPTSLDLDAPPPTPSWIKPDVSDAPGASPQPLPRVEASAPVWSPSGPAAHPDPLTPPAPAVPAWAPPAVSPVAVPAPPPISTPEASVAPRRAEAVESTAATPVPPPRIPPISAAPLAPTAFPPAPAPAASDGNVAVPAPTGWVAEIWIDPDWYAGQDSPDQLPSPGLPRVVGLHKRTLLIGRPSRSRGVTPDLDCETDNGVSRRHAELVTDGTRWWVEDVGSSNGTFVGQVGLPLPVDPIRMRTELSEDARIYVGSWTRIVVRRANPDELSL